MRKAVIFTGAAAVALFLASSPAWGVTAGPDDFGYTLADEAETGVTYAWVDIPSESTATQLTLVDDDQSAALTLGFDFMFYGTIYNQIHVLSNGLLRFSYDSSITHYHGAQCPLPQAGTVDGFIGFYHRDWHPSDSAWCGSDCTVHWATGTDTGGRNWFGVQFTNVPICCSSYTPPPEPDPMTVQCLIYDDHTILVQVQDAGDNTGEDSTIGLEEIDAMTGIVYPGCMTLGSTRDNMAVVFSAPTTGTPILPRRAIGWEQPGNSVTHTFKIYNLDSTDVTFDVAVSGATWTTTPSATSLTVVAGTSETFTVGVTIDSSASGGESDLATITLTPSSGGTAIPIETLTLSQEAPDMWQRVSDMPNIVEEPVVGIDGTDIWLVSGDYYDDFDAQHYVTDIVQKLDMDLLVWEDSVTGTLAPLTAARVDAAGCAMNGHIYVTGGQTGDGTAPNALDTFIYEIATNTWTSGTDLPDGRLQHAVVCDPANNDLYLLGGYGMFIDGSAASQADMWKYDADTDTWDESLPDYPRGPVARHGGALIDADTIIFAGGFDQQSYEFDIPSGTWTRTGDTILVRWGTFTGVLPGGHMCIGGGQSDAVTLGEDTFECIYDGYWIPQIAAMTAARTHVEGGTIGDHIYAIGGGELDSMDPEYYAQLPLVERYPTGPLPDVSIDTAVDTADDTDDDIPGDVVIDVPTDGPTDTSTDAPVDTAGDPDGDDDKGCGCTIVH